jgi:photosystem II stability/assembly factor-like uncharacterized protein
VFNKKTEKSTVVTAIFKSDDQGETWQDVSEVRPSAWSQHGSNSVRTGTPVMNLGAQSSGNGPASLPSVTAGFPGKGIRTVVEMKGGVTFVGSDSGLYKSVNKGATWKQVYPRDMVTKIVESNGILMATSQSGIIRSTDGGDNWSTVLREGGVGIDIQNIKGGFASITYNTTSETRRVRTSYDGGKTWQAIDAGLPASQSIVSITEVGDFLFCGHPAGVFRSADKGKTWKLLLPSVGDKVFNLSVSGQVIYAKATDGGC